MIVDTCRCGSCPVLEQTKDGAFRAGCPNEECPYFALFTLADSDKSFVLEQWNALTNSRKDDND
jgi:hypothetical protein